MAVTRNINLNWMARVKPTPQGIRRYVAHWKKYGIDRQPVLEDGWLRDNLWSLMQVFGEHFHNGMRQDIESEIVIEIP